MLYDLFLFFSNSYMKMSLVVTTAVTCSDTVAITGALSANGNITAGAWQGTAVTVPYGGTGAATHGSGNVLVGAGSGAVTSGKSAPSGDFVGTTDTQTLTNKTLGADLAAGGFKITGLATPTENTDSATKAYVDSVATGLDVKASCRAATTADITSGTNGLTGDITYNSTGGTSARGQITGTLAVSNTFTIDGLTLAAANNGTRILLKDQGTNTENGIWTTTISGTSLILDRATDFDDDAEVTAGAFTFVTGGTANADSAWVLTTDDTVVIGGASGTGLTFAQFTGAAGITAGDGLDKAVNTLSVDLKANGGLVIESTEIALDLGASAITGTLAVADGGTGATTLTSGNVLLGAGASAVTYAKTAPSGDFVGTTDTQTLSAKTLTAPTVTGTAVFTGDITHFDAVNDGNPTISLGSAAAEALVVTATYDSGAQTLASVTFETKAASAVADRGQMLFNVDEANILTIDDGGISVASGGAYEINGTSVLNATTLGAAIVASSLTSVGTIGTGVWEGTDVGVAHGGTGVSTITSGGVVVGAGASAVTSNKAAPSGDFVGTTDTQTLSAKTLTAPTVTGTAIFTGDITHFDAVNDGNPTISLGSAAAEALVVTATYDSGAQTLASVTFETKAASAVADRGQMLFNVDEANILTIDDGGISVASGGAYEINGTSVLNATTLGAAIVASSLTSVGTIGTGVWEGTDVGVAHGGTGVSTITSGGVVVGAGASAVTSNKAAPSGDFVGTTDTQTLTTKTITLGNNTVSGTLAQFNSACTDDNLVSLTGTETLTNKTLTAPAIGGNTLVATTGQMQFRDAQLYIYSSADATLNIVSDGSIVTSQAIPVIGTGCDASPLSYWFKPPQANLMIITQLFIDLENLNCGDTIDDVIGEDTLGNCTFGALATGTFGNTIKAVKIECVETPTGGSVDVDFWDTTTENQTEDTALTGGTETKLINHGAWTLGEVDWCSAMPTVGRYLALTTGAASAAAYTAGQFMVTFYSV